MTVGSATGAPGDRVILAISMDSAGATVMSIQVNLTFDGATLTNAVGTAGAALPTSWLFASNSPAPGDLRFISLDQSGIGQILNGAIFTATLTIDAGASAGGVPIGPFVEVRDELGMALSVTLTDGVVTVSGHRRAHPAHSH